MALLYLCDIYRCIHLFYRYSGWLMVLICILKHNVVIIRWGYFCVGKLIYAAKLKKQYPISTKLNFFTIVLLNCAFFERDLRIIFANSDGGLESYLMTCRNSSTKSFFFCPCTRAFPLNYTILK